MQRTNHTQMIRKLVVSGMLVALVVVLMVTGLGFIRVGPIQASLLCLPIILGVMTEGLGVGFVLGLTFGVLSFIQSFGTPSPLSVFFMNPLISVLPRICIPVVVWLVVKGFKDVSYENAKKKVLLRILASLSGALTNTALVLGAIFIAYSLGYIVVDMEEIYEHGMALFLLFIALTNGLPEAAVMALVTPPVMAALDRTVYKR